MQQVLTAGAANKGTGGFLQYSPVVTLNTATSSWLYKGAPIGAETVYRVVMSDFLFSGKETNLGFLNNTNIAVVKIHEARPAANQPLSDIRLAIVRYLQKKE